MAESSDLAQLVTRIQIQEQCIVRAREEYVALVEEANRRLADKEGIIAQLNKDKLDLNQFLINKLREVCLNIYVCVKTDHVITFEKL